MKNNILFHLSGYRNDLLVLKQWKIALNRIMPLLLGLLKKHGSCAARSVIIFKKASQLMHCPIYNKLCCPLGRFPNMNVRFC